MSKVTRQVRSRSQMHWVLDMLKFPDAGTVSVIHGFFVIYMEPSNLLSV